jgi:AraC-like DNA-binding protein
MKILGRGQFFVVSSYLQQLQSYFKKVNLPAIRLLSNSDLPLYTLSQANLYLGHESIAEVNAHACTLVPSEAELITYLAFERDALTHGSLGIAALLSSDLDDAISIIRKYIRTRYSGIEIDVAIISNKVRINFKVPETNLQSDRLTVLSTLLMFENTLKSTLQLDSDEHEVGISVIYSAPMYWQNTHGHAQVKFDQDCNKIEFPDYLLKKRLLFSNQNESDQASEICKEELNAIKTYSDVSELVRLKLSQSNLPLPNIDVIANSLNLSGRTLRRKLDSLGIQYIDLKLAVMNEKALALLSSSTGSLQQLASELGYCDYKSFSRAFKKSNGMTPSQFRRAI